MHSLTESSLQFGLDSGQKRRLQQFRDSLASDRDKVIFDSKIAELLERYCKPSFSFSEKKDYLNNLRDENGHLYCGSYKQYSQIESQISRFSGKQHPYFGWNGSYQRAKERLISELQQYGKITQVTYRCDEDIRDILPREDTHAGFTFILTGRKHKGENLENICERYTVCEMEARRNGTFNRPIMPGVRTQASGAFDDSTGEMTNTCKLKTRLVSMVDMMQIIAECKFAVPFQRLISYSTQYAGGKNDNGISRILFNLKSRYPFWYSLDYSHFDQSISDWLVKDAFEIIRKSFVGNFDEELYNIIINDFLRKNFITSTGIVYAEKGVPSGSMFTQIVDSLVNLLCVYTMLESLHLKGDCIVMGDDNLLFVNSKVEPEIISQFISRNLGMELNASKFDFGTSRQSVRFLSREWRPGGQWRHPNVLCAKLLFPERWRPYDSGECIPQEVLYGYILTYRWGMEQMMDVPQFLDDFEFYRRSNSQKATRYVPGALSYNERYLMDDSRTKIYA